MRSRPSIGQCAGPDGGDRLGGASHGRKVAARPRPARSRRPGCSAAPPRSTARPARGAPSTKNGPKTVDSASIQPRARATAHERSLRERCATRRCRQRPGARAPRGSRAGASRRSKSAAGSARGPRPDASAAPSRAHPRPSRSARHSTRARRRCTCRARAAPRVRAIDEPRHPGGESSTGSASSAIRRLRPGADSSVISTSYEFSGRSSRRELGIELLDERGVDARRPAPRASSTAERPAGVRHAIRVHVSVW